jgi:1,4-dihydroxy-2-naphthoate octaprenyltransferase
MPAPTAKPEKRTLVVRFGIAQSWNVLAYLTIPTLLLAAGEAISLRTVLGSLAIVPAVIAGLALVRAASATRVRRRSPSWGSPSTL